ncbi:MAG: DegV family protein [Lachnospiraceae bacterium]|nr:DegV family protein [Lachnospiraceae bacterium]
MYKIIIDSCGEIPQNLKEDGRFVNVPLTLEVNGEEIVDDETFDQASFLKKVAESPTGPKSACPSPASYMKAMESEADHIYVITLSAQLSGSYNSAVLAKNLYEEELEDEDEDREVLIHIFDSKSASIGETLIGMKVAELEEAGCSFEEVVAQTEQYISEQHTYFVLETLETLRKAGRLSNLKAMIAGTLNIKPVMGSTDEGNIQQLGQARGMAKALDKMVECMMANVIHPEKRILAISHCNAPNAAEQLKQRVMKACNFRDIFVIDTQGVSSMYANDGGLIMVV